ncbi:MAG: hypothetical protein ACTTH0_02140 [Eubacteriales bacterium]
MFLNKFVKKILPIFVCVAVIFANTSYESVSYASVLGVKATVSSDSVSASQGGKESITYNIKNSLGEAVVVKDMAISIDGDGINITGIAGDATVPAGSEFPVIFKVSVTKNASLGKRNMRFTAKVFKADGVTPINSIGNELSSAESGFTVYEKFATDGQDVGWVAAVDVSHVLKPADGFKKGEDNKIIITLHNYGNSVIKNGVVKINLPDVLSINNDSNQANIGYMGTGRKFTVEFPISVEDAAQSKNYPIEVTVQGQDFMRGDVKTAKTIYVPVIGDAKDDIKNDLNIVNVTAPAVVAEKSTFDVGFSVTNSGKKKLRAIKITAEPADGLLNRSKNIFIDNFDAGETKNYNISYYAQEAKDGKSCSIKINAESTNTDDKNKSQVSQYAVVAIEGSSTGGAKKPQLMVDSYTYGAASVQAGGHFMLNLGILNTSSQELSNIKVSLTDEGGVFVPAGGSNSFFIERISGKAHYTKSMAFDVKPQAEQKTTSMTVKITYETKGGEALESSDIIAIPVTQKTRLVVDEFVPPQEAYVGMPVGCELQFYNMGKTVLNNLKINCSGEFDITQSNSYYAGNMEGGKSDTYSFTVVPREAGKVSGIVTFTFENTDGEAQVQEVPFEFEAIKEPPMEDDEQDMNNKQKKVPWSLIIFAAVVVIMAVTGIVVKKIRRKKAEKDLEIDDFDV